VAAGASLSPSTIFVLVSAPRQYRWGWRICPEHRRVDRGMTASPKGDQGNEEDQRSRATSQCSKVRASNAGHQARLEAGARHERTLEGVACMPWFGAPPLVCRLPCGGHCLCPRWASNALEPLAERHGQTAIPLDDDSTVVERPLQCEACG